MTYGLLQIGYLSSIPLFNILIAIIQCSPKNCIFTIFSKILQSICIYTVFPSLPFFLILSLSPLPLSSTYVSPTSPRSFHSSPSPHHLPIIELLLHNLNERTRFINNRITIRKLQFAPQGDRLTGKAVFVDGAD